MDVTSVEIPALLNQPEYCVETLRGKLGANAVAALRGSADKWSQFDPYDRHATHICISSQVNGRLIASARFIDEQLAARVGNFSVQNTFDITSLHRVIGRVAELSEIHVDSEFAEKNVVKLLMDQVATLTDSTDIAGLLIPMTLDVPTENRIDDGTDIRANMLPEYMRVTPKAAVRKSKWSTSRSIPSNYVLNVLFSDYAAKVCGDPRLNPLAQTIDVCLLVPLKADALWVA